MLSGGYTYTLIITLTYNTYLDIPEETGKESDEKWQQIHLYK